MAKRGPENSALREAIVFLEKSARKNKAPIWGAVAEKLAKPRRSRVEVNLGRLAKLTKANDVVVVPGKLLGAGEPKHAVTVASWSAAEGVREKLTKHGGKLMTIRELVESNPRGSGVIIMQ